MSPVYNFHNCFSQVMDSYIWDMAHQSFRIILWTLTKGELCLLLWKVWTEMCAFLVFIAHHIDIAGFVFAHV